MLDRLQRLASWMRPAAPFLVLAGMALLLLCLALLFLTDGGERGDKLLLPAIVAMIWCLCGYASSWHSKQCPHSRERNYTVCGG